MDKFEFVKQPTFEDFKEVQGIEREFLKEETIATAEQTFAWSKKNPDIEIFIRDVIIGKVVGSLTITPLNEEQYNKFIAGTLQDTELSAETLERYEGGQKYWLLFAAVAIRKAYQGKGLFNMLMKGFALKIKELEQRGISFANICGEGQTMAGRRIFQELIGLEKIDGNFEFPLYYFGKGDQSEKVKDFFEGIKNKYLGGES